MMHEHLDWPFFDAGHRTFADALQTWIAVRATMENERGDIDERCREWVRALGEAGWLRYCVEAVDGGMRSRLDSRMLCLARETLAYHDGLADFAFAMQGLGSGAITLAGSTAQRARWLPLVAQGVAIAAFALSEPDAGSDVGGMRMQAKRERDGWTLDGCKTWISNGGIADFYCVFARTGDGSGAQGISAFVVPADAAGLTVSERIELIAPHPLARLEFRNCRLPVDALLGEEGAGFKLAMRTLDIFRTSVAASALGLARRALDEALQRASSRRMFGRTLGDFQLTQAKLGEMASAIDAAALLTYRAAWLRDARDQRTTKEAAMAKMMATESAQVIIDAAVQMFGGQGLVSGEMVERLYREIRALRIYEGATEVQKLIVGRELLRRGQEEQ